ncbi:MULTISPECIES: tryptophan--tRNA ligase [Treponema]|uniref:Tryptophan--tRNA ligase n=1 Tax=Treponema porcinum TaxID=261392 RepID=A0A1T4JV24_TREPO|nr:MULTISPECIES: tryptophan--tRNA ligase [Treponema]MCI6179976.1 tryptophan--tRNA ligase [Treponema porcinum]MCI6323001.1 tryptophan--tRNA ligase [Treponema porcinum]MCI6722593.1 tryptophan--tRNA ligase [Treponema porcinum]MCI6815350.1 tryptophan--tRNA ligase [Treponema porcinum]MCI6983978.1 tryptophan--tRNA ligase [Treponema porcinum]
MAELEYSGTYEAALATSRKIEEDIVKNPQKYRVLTGDRPTGRLHIGHYFGSLKNRVRLSKLGVPTMILIADYQVLTDHDAYQEISQNTKQLVIDYLAAGIEPGENVMIYPHSYIPEANQLMVPFLTLVSNAELSRNPTVKEEIQAAGLKNVNAGMYTYPVHQAVDILYCKGNVVPVGKDQLPHLEMTRTIARRFNEKFCKGREPVFPMPQALLSKTPSIMGLDGCQKMSKSRGNAIMLSATEDETAKLIKKAKTDGERLITYDPVNRPEVANLLSLISLCTQEAPEDVAARIGEGGGGMLKNELTVALNEELRPLRQKRAQLEKDPAYIRSVLLDGVKKAREIAEQTLSEVREVMNMVI